MQTTGHYEVPRGGDARRFVLRLLVGFFPGAVVGALPGALALIALVGPGEYARSVADDRPAGI